METELAFRLLGFTLLLGTFGISIYFRRKANVMGADEIDFSE